MRFTRVVIVGILSLAAAATAQTAEELVAKNLQARGGVDKIKAINTLTMTGKAYVGIDAQVSQENKRADMITISLTGAHAVPLYNVYSQLVYALKGSDVTDVMVNGRLVARGEVVVVDEDYGIRITEIVSAESGL